jgi:polygalacturonase
MERRGFLRRFGGVALAAPHALVPLLRRGGQWAARLDDPAYGGRGDGTVLNDDALLQALEDMPTEGGTIVLPPAPAWLFDSVDLARVGRRRVTLVATGATLLKAARTPHHLFHDIRGTSHGLTVIGGTFDLSRDASARTAVRVGATVSAFFLVRADDVSFVDVTVRNGIEEGLKLYTPRRLRVRGGVYEHLVNNGIQIHAPGADGFRGDAPPRDTEDVRVEGAVFRAIDDGLHGMEGQGVSVSGASPRVTARNVRVTNCTFERCVRGAWAEFNEPGKPGLDIRFDGNAVTLAECHGLGLVGVRGGGMRGNRVLDTGRLIPGQPGVAASEVAGIVVSGSQHTPGEDVVVEENEVIERRTGGDARMQYGILGRRQLRFTERRNVVRGATLRGVEVEG